MNPDRYYKKTGAVPFPGTLIMQMFAAVAALLFGFAYAALQHYCTIAWLRVFGPFVFGALVGGVVRWGAAAGKVRSTGFIKLIGIAAAVVGLYVSWVFYFWFGSKQQMMPWDPQELWLLMQLMAEVGAWAFRDWQPTGLVLYGFWAAEMIAVCAVAYAVADAKDCPFCNVCNQWTNAKPVPPLFPLTDVDKLRTDLEADRYEVLDDLVSQPAHPRNHLTVTVYACPNCQDSTYLTVSHQVATFDGEGNEVMNNTDLIKFLQIPDETGEHLLGLDPGETAEDGDDPDAIEVEIEEEPT